MLVSNLLFVVKSWIASLFEGEGMRFVLVEQNRLKNGNTMKSNELNLANKQNFYILSYKIMCQAKTIKDTISILLSWRRGIKFLSIDV